LFSQWQGAVAEITGIVTEMLSEQKQFFPVAVGQITGWQSQKVPKPALPAWAVTDLTHLQTMTLVLHQNCVRDTGYRE